MTAKKSDRLGELAARCVKEAEEALRRSAAREVADVEGTRQAASAIEGARYAANVLRDEGLAVEATQQARRDALRVLRLCEQTASALGELGFAAGINAVRTAIVRVEEGKEPFAS